MMQNFKLLVTAISLLVGVNMYSADIYYVSKKGNDNNNGTSKKPWLTISKAAQTMMPGDKVIVREGIYNETVSPLRGGTCDLQRITYQAAKGEKVVISGSEKFTTWVKQNENTYKLTIPNSYFGSYNPYKVQSFKGMDNKLFEDHNGLVIFNDKGYSEKYNLDEVILKSETWYVMSDSVNTEIFANFGGQNPNTGDAQIAVRKQCFAPISWGLGYITIDGFTVKNAANPYSDWPSFPERAQYGMISVAGGLKWIIENNTIMNARTIGIDIGLGCDEWAGNKGKSVRTHFSETDRYGSHIIRNNQFKYNGQSGIVGVFCWNSDILNNTFIGTNTRNEFKKNTESAALKVHYNNEGLIEGNYFYNNGCMALWTDWGNQGLRISKNLFVDQKWMSEALHGPLLFDNNIMVNTALHSLPSKGIIFVHNLIINAKVEISKDEYNALYYKPHTMSNGTEALVSPSYYRVFNNIFTSKDTSDFPKTNSIESNNYYNAGSEITYTATDTSFTLNFNINNEPFANNPFITDAFIGPIPPSNQGIAVSVDKDYFGYNINASSPIAGPFSKLAIGSNQLVLWPRK
jgi:hypothetical protein